MTWFPLRREGSAPLLAFPSHTTVVPNLDSNPRPNLHSLGRMNISHSRQAVPRGLVTPLEMTWLPNKTGWVCLAVRTLVLNTFVPRIFLATSILGSIWARESKGVGNPWPPTPNRLFTFLYSPHWGHYYSFLYTLTHYTCRRPGFSWQSLSAFSLDTPL